MMEVVLMAECSLLRGGTSLLHIIIVMVTLEVTLFLTDLVVLTTGIVIINNLIIKAKNVYYF